MGLSEQLIHENTTNIPCRIENLKRLKKTAKGAYKDYCRSRIRKYMECESEAKSNLPAVLDTSLAVGKIKKEDVQHSNSANQKST